MQLLRGNLCASPGAWDTPEGISAQETGKNLLETQQGELCLTQDHTQHSLPDELMLSRSQIQFLGSPKCPVPQAGLLPEVSSELPALPVVQEPLPPPVPVQPLQHLQHLLQLGWGTQGREKWEWAPGGL